jgi:superfamily II DNA or RNA helicase
MELRDYQIEAFEALKKSFLNGDGKGLLVLATGLGKTVVAEAFLQWLFEEKYITKCAVLCHLSAGTDQLVKKFTESTFVGDQTTARYESEEDLKASIVCTTYHKVFQAKDFPFESFDLVIADEAHHTPATMFSLVTESFSEAVYRLGLTATPFRLDGQQLSELFGETVYEQDLLWGIEHGWLAQMAYWSITSHLNSEILNQLEASGRKISLKEINRRLFDQADPLKVWEELQERCPGEQAIIFCRSIAHAEAVQAAFESQKPGCSALISSKKSKEANQRSLNAYGAGDVLYLVGVDMPIEMLDFPNTSVIVLWRVSQSLRIFLQSLGRGLRKHEDKEQLTVLDFVGFAENVTPWDEFTDFSGFEDADEVEGVGRRVQLVPGLTLWGDVSYVEIMSKVESLLSRLTVADLYLMDDERLHVMADCIPAEYHHLTLASHQSVPITCHVPECGYTEVYQLLYFTGGASFHRETMRRCKNCGSHPVKGTRKGSLWSLIGTKYQGIIDLLDITSYKFSTGSGKKVWAKCLNPRCGAGAEIHIRALTGGKDLDPEKMTGLSCCKWHPYLGLPKGTLWDLMGTEFESILYILDPKICYISLASRKQVFAKCLNPECGIGATISIRALVGQGILDRGSMKGLSCCGWHPLGEVGWKSTARLPAINSLRGGSLAYLLDLVDPIHHQKRFGSKSVINITCTNPQCGKGCKMPLRSFFGGLGASPYPKGFLKCCGWHPHHGNKKKGVNSRTVSSLSAEGDEGVLKKLFPPGSGEMKLGSLKEVTISCPNPDCLVGSCKLPVRQIVGGTYLDRLGMKYFLCCNWHPIKGYKRGYGPPKDSKDKK